MRIKFFFKSLIITAFLTLPVLAQDSVDVTFRYYPENTVTRVMLPGEFNNFGPNNSGQISPSAPSLMEYDFGGQFWFKTIRLEVGGGTSLNNSETGYRYKFHEHYNASGSNYAWLSDPLVSKTSGNLGDSWFKVTHPLIFQVQPVSGAIFQLEEPGFTATVAGKTDDLINEANSKIYINGQEASSFSGYYNSTLQILTVPALSDLGVALVEGTNTIKIEAVSENGASVTDSTQFTYISEPQPVDAKRPSGLEDGITYGANGTSVTFSLFAPYKDYAFLIGDFNDWSVELEYQMNRDSIDTDSIYFWYELTGLTPGQEYGFQYLVDGELRVTDPYAELVLDEFNDEFIPASVFPNLKEYPKGKTSDLVGVITPGKPEYQWEVTDFQKPANDELVIYELLMRDFIADHSYKTLLDTLDYLSDLGINAIEFMPINEFDGNESWGYNPSLHGALDKYYGSPDDFKRFVDEAHKRGIAIIIDVVLNHSFGQNPIVRLWNEGNYGNPTSQNPYFNTSARHPFNVGYDMNHESPSTRYYSKRMMKYWIEEYKVDGYRFDLSKGFTQTNNPNNVGAWSAYDQSRVNIWLDYSSYIWSIDPDAYIILEHLSDNSEEVALANAGMMLWGNMNHEYNEASMGYSSNLSGVLSENRGFNDRHLVSYMESHDEQWMMFKNRSFGNSSGDYNVRNLSTALDRQELAGAFFFTLPGPKMLWQFGELGYGYGDSGEQCLKPGSGNGDCKVSDPGRTDKKPIRWDYFSNPDRVDLYNTWADIINLRRSSPVFTNPESTFYALSGSVKYVRMFHTDSDVVIIGNFGVTSTNQNVDFTKDGTWYDFFGNSSIEVSGGVSNMDLAPGEFKIFTTKQFNIGTSSEEYDGNEEPITFKLHQNYPNPFNPSTTINYDVARNGLVSIEVYDIVGRKVAELVNEVKSAGSYSVQFDASSLSSGIYFARLEAGSAVQIQKMTLVK